MKKTTVYTSSREHHIKRRSLQGIPGLHSFMLMLFAHMLLPASEAFSFSLQKLPSDESEASEMLSEGTLDSLTWELVKPFYVQPLSVPHGELSVLMELFPELPGNLPVSPDSLSRYYPWDQSRIEQFLEDYPELVPFLPILRFYLPSVSSTGRVGFFYHGPLKNSCARIVVDPVRILSFQGRVDFADDVARWYQRSLTLKASHWCRVNIGNFKGIADRGLFTGYFPFQDESRRNVSQNWLYGRYASWNGIAVELSESEGGSSARVYYHNRLQESITGASVEFKTGALRNQIGGIYLRLPETGKRYYYLHTGLKLDLKRLIIDAGTGVDLQNSSAIPLLFRAQAFGGRNRFDFQSVFLPGGFSAPRSRIIRKVPHNSGTGLSGSCLSINLQLWHSISDHFRAFTAVEGLFMEKVTENVKGSFSLFGNFRNAVFNLGYSRVEWTREERKNDILEFTAGLRGAFRPEASQRVTFVNGIPVYSCRISSTLNFLPKISLVPLFSFRKEAGECCEYMWGIKKSLTLFERTCLELLVENDREESVRIEAKAWFLIR